MKKFLSFILLAGGLVLSSCASVSYQGMPVTSSGTIYNFTTEENDITFTILDSFECSWADTNNLQASYFTLPESMKGKTVSKIIRNGDKVITLTLKGNANTDDVSDKTILISKDAYKGATVEDSYALINYGRTGIYCSSCLSSSTQVICDGVLKGCLGCTIGDSFTAKINLTSGSYSSDQIVVKGFTAGYLTLTTDCENNIEYILSDYTMEEGTTETEYSITVKPEYYNNGKYLFSGIDKPLQFNFEKRTDASTYLQPTHIYGNQYFIA